MSSSWIRSSGSLPTAIMGVGNRFLHRVVKNDAMKIDPPEIYNPRIFLLALTSCFGGTLFGMDIGIIGGVITMDTFEE